MLILTPKHSFMTCGGPEGLTSTTVLETDRRTLLSYRENAHTYPQTQFYDMWWPQFLIIIIFKKRGVILAREGRNVTP